MPEEIHKTQRATARPIKVTVGLVPFGGVKYLAYSLKSLLEQDYANIEYLFLDQEEGKYSASKWIEAERPEWLDQIELWQGPNLWHSGGMNRLMMKMKGEIFIAVSQDMLYPRDFVSKIVEFFAKNQRFDFASARLLRWDFENLKTTEQIDSLGIKIDTFHRAFEIGQGQQSEATKKPFEEVMGASAALLALTRKCIDKVKFQGQVFDENLHYKNDVDLAYRLQWAGCRGAVLNDLVVYHDRFISGKSKKPFWVVRQSLFGDWWFIKKNFSWRYSILTHLKTWSYLLAKTGYLLVTNPKLIGVFGDLWGKRKLLGAWRRGVRREIGVAEMEGRLK